MFNPDAINAEKWLNADEGRMQMAEEYIFLSALHSFDFWLTAAEKLCVDPVSGKSIDDFDRLERNIIFTGLRKLGDVAVSDDKDEESSVSHATHPKILKEFLTREATTGQLCSVDEIPGVIEFYENALSEKDKAKQLTGLAKKFLPVWLSRKRREYIASITRDMSIDDMLQVSEQHADAVSNVGSDSTSLFMFGNHPRNKEVAPGVGLLTLPNLAESLGGFYKGGAYMFQAPTGGGKTVAACQILLDFISQGMKGLFISTEQPWLELEPRLISNACDIPMDTAFLGNQFDYYAADKLGPAAGLDKIVAWEKSIKDSFVFSHWNTDNTQSVRTDLEATYRKAKNMLGQEPDFVILDWIGGALGSDTNSDNLRFTYQISADAFASACQKHKFIGIAFAQTKADRVYYSLGSEQLAECKTMHRKYSALVGITAIEVPGDKSQSANTAAKYQLNQFIDVAKSRKGVAERIRVKRDFKYQRFIEGK